MRSHFLVVGSGPAGVAAASALLEAGHQVTLVDGGKDVPPELLSKIKNLKSRSLPFSDEDIAFAKENFHEDASGVAQKTFFGSSFAYEANEALQNFETENIGHLLPTLAVGGYSRIWGAAALDFPASEIENWPISRAELEPYYQKVQNLLKVVGDPSDSLAKVLGHSHCWPVNKKFDGLNFLSDAFQSVGTELKKNGFEWGQSRLALNEVECKRCGLCMYGCPWDYIYSTVQTLELLSKNPNFSYEKGRIVESLSKESEIVRIKFADAKKSEEQHQKFTRVFLAAGPLSTTALLGRSGLHEKIRMPVSEYFIIPFLSLRARAELLKSSVITLSQMFVEIRNSKLSPRSIHLQFYGYNDLYELTFKKMLGPIFGLIRWFVLPRFFVAQGYLHSDVSSHIEMDVDSAGVRLKGVKSEIARKTIFQTAKSIFGLLWKKGILPLLPVVKVGQPGDGRHVGAQFPMVKNPEKLQTNLLGQLKQFSGVHIVDSSVLPSLPAQTITFTVMANAYRIAKQVGDLYK